VPITSADLTDRLERADRARLALRRTTLDLQRLGAQLRQVLAQRHAPWISTPSTRPAQLNRSRTWPPGAAEGDE